MAAVLVAGATGTTGSAVLRQLVGAGVQVRALTRSHDRLAGLRGPGVTPVVADFADRAQLRAALDGVTAAYLATPSSPDMAVTEGTFARAAADAGVHLVKLSTMGASPDSPLRFARMHAQSEAAIEAAGGGWTFLQPNGFMQNDLAWAAQVPSGTIAGPVLDSAWSIVDVRDVAGVAAAALTDPAGHAQHRVVVTGPQARAPRDRVAALVAVLGRRLTVIDVPVPAVLEQLRGYGLSSWEADGIGELLDLYVQGVATGVVAGVDGILGRPRKTWEDFALDHAGVFSAAVSPATG